MSVFRLSVTAVIFFLMASLAFGRGESGAGARLSEQLSRMGYVDVSLDHCAVRYSQSFPPRDDSNGYYRHERLLRLDSIKGIARSIIVEDPEFSVAPFTLILETNREYYERYRETYFFKDWVRENFREIEWPYKSPKLHDKMTPFIEGKAYSQIPEIEKLNLSIYYTNFGRSTTVELNPSILDPSELDLKQLKSALSDYSMQNLCGDI